ncbi:hypothetical protein TIFTF001_030751 [Ficus carica]|uniref:Uncharacterized protein n=1 Tax=Ficus carica TaxID=3494 RepID=A0AA88DU66_FICCA|nr:hypothetical protein TIFTF001_030751 [Ficus carica]
MKGMGEGGRAPHRRLDICGAVACHCRGCHRIGCRLSPRIVGLAGRWSVAWGRGPRHRGRKGEGTLN